MGGIMKREEVERFVEKAVEKIIQDTELELVDVEYVREREWYLRIFLDKTGGIDLDDCQFVSKLLSDTLDREDPVKENYLLEVSSPGLDRVLKKDKDFTRYAGSLVDIRFFKTLDGKKVIVGKLIEKNDDEQILIEVDEKQECYDLKLISQIRLHLEF